jgi:hypothetical protein
VTSPELTPFEGRRRHAAIHEETASKLLRDHNFRPMEIPGVWFGTESILVCYEIRTEPEGRFQMSSDLIMHSL